MLVVVEETAQNAHVYVSVIAFGCDRGDCGSAI